jgi:hypothetical protein
VVFQNTCARELIVLKLNRFPPRHVSYQNTKQKDVAGRKVRGIFHEYNHVEMDHELNNKPLVYNTHAQEILAYYYQLTNPLLPEMTQLNKNYAVNNV